jgi:hypothetical protein
VPTTTVLGTASATVVATTSPLADPPGPLRTAPLGAAVTTVPVVPPPASGPPPVIETHEGWSMSATPPFVGTSR